METFYNKFKDNIDNNEKLKDIITPIKFGSCIICDLKLLGKEDKNVRIII